MILFFNFHQPPGQDTDVLITRQYLGPEAAVLGSFNG